MSEERMSEERNAKLRGLLAGYNESIRITDGKATIAVLFVAIMMGTVIQYQNFYPWYLPLPLLLLPFMFIFVNLLVSVYPRFPAFGPDPLSGPAPPAAGGSGLPAGGRFASRHSARDLCSVLAHTVVEKHHAAAGLHRRHRVARRLGVSAFLRALDCAAPGRLRRRSLAIFSRLRPRREWGRRAAVPGPDRTGSRPP